MKMHHAIGLMAAAFIGPLAAQALPAQKPDLATAKAYVDQIYRKLPGAFDYHQVRYAPQLKQLIAKDAAASKGEIGAIEGVPFCDCQDTARGYTFSSTVAPAGPGRATVTVSVRNPSRETPSPQTFRIDLVATGAQWAVADIRGPRLASLVGYLRGIYK